MGRASYQVAIVDASVTAQNVLSSIEGVNAQGGSVAATLLETEYSASTYVLHLDTTNIDNISAENQTAAVNNGGQWTSAETDAFNSANQVYQQDSSVTQTGQSNASTAVSVEQTQVSADGTNLSNFLSLSAVFVNIGAYMSNMLARGYTSN